MRDSLASLSRWLCLLVLVGLLVARVARSGGFVLNAPATVFSHAFPAQRAQEPLLLFLGEVRERVPAGAAVAILAAGDQSSVYLLALGQLPRQRVVVASGDEPTPARARLPEYAAAFGREVRHPDYRRIARLTGGWLYRRAEP